MSFKEASAHVPLVSAIIPAFNTEEFIEEAINSVLHQTYSNIEIIVIDDGSTDNTRDKVAPYNNIRYLYQEHSGISEARNKGIENANGEYVAFLDADDLWVPNKTEIQMKYLIDGPECAAFSSDWLTFENDKVISESYLYSRYIDAEKSFYENLLRENIALTSTVIAKKQAILAVGMFDPSFRTYEDRDLMLRIAARFKFGLIEEVLVKKRSHPKQTSRPVEAVMKGQILLYTKVRRHHPIISKDCVQLIGKKLVNLYVSISYYYLQKGKMELARTYIKEAIRLKPHLIKPWKIYLLSHIPIKYLSLSKKNKDRTRH